MKNLVSVLLALGLLLTEGFADELNLYVASKGNDSWTGRQADIAAGNNGPFARIERARDEIRKLKQANALPSGPINVYIREGIYPISSTIEFNATDCGTVDSHIRYQAYKNERPRIIGGREVTNFQPVTNAEILKQLDPAARANVLQADIKELGVTDFGEVTPGGNRFELFFEDRPMTLARWPNDSYTKTGELLGGKPNISHGRKGDEIGKFTYEDNRPSRWKHEKDIWLSGYWFWDWADEYQQIDSIDTDKRIINTKPPYHRYGYRKGQRYYALNLLSEIDSPGEWYLDRQAGLLYFWPPSDIAKSKAYISLLKNSIAIKNTSFITIQGLMLEFNRSTTIDVKDGSHVRIVGCTIRNIGGKAVQIDGGSEHSVIGCDIYDTGDGGVSLNGGNRVKLVPGNHLALNNHFYRYSRNSKTYRPAISVNGIGHRVAHNLIHDAPHMAIQFGGNEHIIEFNEIYHVCMETDDAGAIYSGRDWTWRGNRVQYNYLHHMGDYNTGVGVMSVYLDDGVSATTVFGNVIYKGGRAVLVGGGRNTLVDNNIFVDCSPAVHVDSRYQGWAKSWFEEPDNSLRQALKAMPYKQPPWSTRYPELVNAMEDEPNLAKYNTVSNNICVGGKWLDLHDKLTDKVVKIENNMTDQDPMFVDAAKGDFRLKPESPAYKQGFKLIPFEKIGLYQDDQGASWPPPPRPLPQR